MVSSSGKLRCLRLGLRYLELVAVDCAHLPWIIVGEIEY